MKFTVGNCVVLSDASLELLRKMLGIDRRIARIRNHHPAHLRDVGTEVWDDLLLLQSDRNVLFFAGRLGSYRRWRPS